MARLIKNREHGAAALPNFAIESKDFVRILERVFGKNKEIKILIGSYSDASRTLLEGIDDINSNISLLRGEIEVSAGDVSISIGDYGAKIQFPEPRPALVEALLEELTAFTPWYRQLSRIVNNVPWYIFIGTPLAIFVAFQVFRETLPLKFQTDLLPVGFWIITFGLTAYLGVRYNAPVIFYSARDNWLQRNKDKIIWSAIATFLTAATTFIGPKLLQQNLTPIDQTSITKQNSATPLSLPPATKP